MTRSDFKQLPDLECTLDEQIKEVAYELAMRENAYPHFIKQGRLKPQDAQRHYQVLKAVLRTLQAVKREQESPDPLGEALNSGRGVYIP
ncbi:MAG: hypothetical protein NZN28_11940 [Meiothermus sp.]|uniref:hypothetical protein n=1 Tax=Meiothermus sp. TaxID=1955249 RepID=UPI0025F81AF5|nr:hypothetical protein [Meiothermus sp.]MCS7069323.1 hypothetical protein [Meiothermus sp.]